jgi:hypothetical protein
MQLKVDAPAKRQHKVPQMAFSIENLLCVPATIS